MHRRHFLTASITGLVAPALVLSATMPTGDTSSVARQIFYDPRFCPGLPANLGRAHAMAVDSDVTGVWRSWLAETTRREPLLLEGWTTESFHFCLVNLLREQASVRTELRRLDRNLHYWVIHSTPHLPGGVPT